MKRIIFLLISVILILSLVGCSNDNELLKTPFSMEVHKTYMNGAYYHTYPEKVFYTDELFNILNSADAENAFEVNQRYIKYKIVMNNGEDYTTFDVWNNGTIDMNYNFLNKSRFFLSGENYIDLTNLLEN